MPDNKTMAVVHDSSKIPTVDEIVQQYGIDPGDIDRDFGVVSIDPRDHAYTVLVAPEAARKISSASGNRGFQGPYSNPKIETFGIK